MNDNPIISIIMPVYNTERYIKKSIESILNQTFTDFELILIDDGSTDNSSSICEEYSKCNDRISVIHKENEGQGVARNIGIKYAKGEYLSFIDSDDYVDEDFLESLLSAIKQENADIALSDLKAIEGTISFDIVHYNKKIVLDNNELMEAYVQGKIQPGFVEKLYRKSLFEEIEFPSVRAKEDYYIMHLVLAKCNKAVHIGECKYTVVVRSDSTEHKKFNENKMVLIDGSIRLKEFIQIKYPNLYSYVVMSPNVSRIEILEDIIGTHSYFKFKDIYDKIQEDILYDYDKNKNYLKEYPSARREDVEFYISNYENYYFVAKKKLLLTKVNKCKVKLRKVLVKLHLLDKK